SSSSLYMRKRLPLPKARMETRAPVLPRMRVGTPFALVVFGAAVAAAATAAAPRNSLRDTLMHSLLSHHLTPMAGLDAGSGVRECGEFRTFREGGGQPRRERRGAPCT